MVLQENRQLSMPEVRALTLASIGGALEFYDFIIFVFFADVIGKLFFAAATADWVRQAQVFGIFSTGYLARPIGGIVMAHFGDTRGRKRVFTLSVLLMAIPTFLIGVLPTYQSIGIAAPVLLLLLRVLQGIAIGGEAPGAWVFVAEHARRGRVGFAVLSHGNLVMLFEETVFRFVCTPRKQNGGICGVMWPDNRVRNLLGIEFPIIQAPMSGVAISEMAVAVSEAGGLGSLASGESK
jgi:hypothetical protein